MDDSSTLAVAFAPGVTVTKWARIWAERFPQIPLNLIPTSQVHQVSVVLEGSSQLSFVRLPIETQGLHVIPLYRERAVAVAAKDHVIAAAESITLSDLAGETQHALSPEHGDRGAFDLVAAGVGVVVVPQSIARQQSRKDVVVRPITDAPETQIALVWRAGAGADSGAEEGNAVGPDTRADLIEAFIGIVRGRTAQSSRSAAPEAGSPTKKKPVTARQAPKGHGKASSGTAQRSGAAHARNRKRTEAKKKRRGR